MNCMLALATPPAPAAVYKSVRIYVHFFPYRQVRRDATCIQFWTMQKKSTARPFQFFFLPTKFFFSAFFFIFFFCLLSMLYAERRATHLKTFILLGISCLRLLIYITEGTWCAVRGIYGTIYPYTTQVDERCTAPYTF